MPTGSPVTPGTGLYAQESDVLRLLRGDDTNISTSDIDTIIEQKTRYIEKETVTAFRPLEIQNVVVDITPSEQQQYDTRKRRGIGYRDRLAAPEISNDRYIDVILPTDRLREVQKLEVITDGEIEDITADLGDLWRKVDPNEGQIQINQVAFNRTFDASLGGDYYEGARIRIDYTYGRDDTRPDIVEAASKLTMYELVTSDAFGDIHPDNIDQVQPTEMTDRYKQDAEDIIDEYR
jgi:hypothetical protein